MKHFNFFLIVLAGFLLTFTLAHSVSAQNSLFMIPQNPENSFNVDTEISNTGAGVCEVSYQGNPATLSVMVWDGEQQGFGWDLDYGSETGYQSLYIDEYINDPDIVVTDGDWGILAHIVYDVRNSYHGGYSYTYSLVNGYDPSGWEQGNQYHPCIASRFSVDEKIIGWYDDETYKPDYKLRQVNVEIFGVEVENDPDIIYPNPSSRWLNIALPEGEKQADFIIFSLQGKPVMRGECQKEFNSFDVSGLSKGIYLVDIQLKSKTIRKKFIKL